MAPNPSGTAGVTRRRFLAAVGATGGVGVAGCIVDNTANDSGAGRGDGGNGSLAGDVVVTGSSTVFPVSDAMAERFMEQNPGVNVTTDSTGSGGGFENHFCPGDSDVNGSSRVIKDAEQEHCSENGVTPIEMEIAGDALTMAVSMENDWVDCMSFEQLAQIWRNDGAETWAEVDPDWPDEEFELYGPDTTSGTYDWFTENVVGESGNHRTDYEPTEDDNIIIRGLENDPYAIGYLGYAYFAENSDRARALAIKEDEEDECADPSLDAAREGTYPMSRPLYIYPAAESLRREEVYEFVRFYVENSAADWVADEIGYVPANQGLVDENIATLEEAAER